MPEEITNSPINPDQGMNRPPIGGDQPLASRAEALPSGDKQIGDIIPLDLSKYFRRQEFSDKFNEYKNPLPDSEPVEAEEPGGFEEVAGQDEAVREARKLVNAINHPEVFAKRGVKRPKGILLYGPPGTGKTLIARAIATEADAEFISVSGADVQSKWVNHSTELMQDVFNRANQVVGKGKRVILFFDEIDAIAPTRSSFDTGVREDEKVLAVMLQNMDGMLANPGVTILAATNRPDIVDPALKRPGRMDKVIEVGLPQKPEERRAILEVHIKKAKKAATEAGSLFSPELDLDAVAATTRGMSGAELANLINLALEEKVALELEGTPWTPVTTEELVARVPTLKQEQEEKRRIGFPIPQRNNSPTY